MSAVAAKPMSENRVAALAAEANHLTARLAEVVAELSTLLSESHDERFARYRSPEFTRQLFDHMKAAKQAALSDSNAAT